MAIIQSYPINNNVKDTDLLLGITNIAPSGNPIYQTKSFRVSDVRGSGSTTSPSYAQFSYNASSPPGFVTFSQANVWKPFGLIATLNTPSPGFSLGTTDKFALKNTSGSTKTINVAVCVIGSITPDYAYPTVALAINGSVIAGSLTTPASSITNINWVIEVANGDEISIYTRSASTSSIYSIYSAKMSVFQI